MNSGGRLGGGRLGQTKDLALVLVDTVTQVLGVEVGLGLQVVSLRHITDSHQARARVLQESVGGITQRLS